MICGAARMPTEACNRVRRFILVMSFLPFVYGTTDEHRKHKCFALSVSICVYLWFQPLTAPDDRPATRCRCAAKEKISTGRITSTPEAVMLPQPVPVSPPEKAAISTGSVRVALLVSTAANRKSFHAS